MKLKYISWIPAAILMVIIFSFSAKEAKRSDESSLTIANSLLETYENISNVTLDNVSRIQTLSSINHIVRKGAHFSEYALLAITLAFHFYVWGKRKYKLALLSILLTAAYAATDEFHQLFVAGRSGELKDVGIDTSGAIFGTILFFLLLLLMKKIGKNKHFIEMK
ncbi:MAG: hypothetical protein K0S47_2095 [Herbinix sp.]|jgi:VanZ family protein|nr:hypothetical protein [Herbinix sp.]